MALGCGVKQGGASPFFLSPSIGLRRGARLGWDPSPSRVGRGLLSKRVCFPGCVLIEDTPLCQQGQPPPYLSQGPTAKPWRAPTGVQPAFRPRALCFTCPNGLPFISKPGSGAQPIL